MLCFKGSAPSITIQLLSMYLQNCKSINRIKPSTMCHCYIHSFSHPPFVDPVHISNISNTSHKHECNPHIVSDLSKATNAEVSEMRQVLWWEWTSDVPLFDVTEGRRRWMERGENERQERGQVLFVCCMVVHPVSVLLCFIICEM